MKEIDHLEERIQEADAMMQLARCSFDALYTDGRLFSGRKYKLIFIERNSINNKERARERREKKVGKNR